MRILATADLHYRLPHLDWLVDNAADFDVVALPGDHLDIVGAAPLPAQMVVVTRYLQDLAERSTLLVTSGNHDLDTTDGDGEKIPEWVRRLSDKGLHTDGERVELDGVRFTLCPWWDGPHTKAAVDEQLRRDADGGPGTWAWLYHSPPAGTGLCKAGRRDFPDDDLRGWIEQWQPDLVFCGHIHQAPWVPGGAWAERVGRTWVFNAGKVAGPVPAHVIVDTDAGTADWVALPDRETIDLDQ